MDDFSSYNSTNLVMSRDGAPVIAPSELGLLKTAKTPAAKAASTRPTQLSGPILAQKGSSWCVIEKPRLLTGVTGEASREIWFPEICGTCPVSEFNLKPDGATIIVLRDGA